MQHIFIQAGIEDIAGIQALARRIWDEAYSEILSEEQVDYMLQVMYSEKVIEEEHLSGTVWELIVVNGKPCGYLSYLLAEDKARGSIYYRRFETRASIIDMSSSFLTGFCI